LPEATITDIWSVERTSRAVPGKKISGLRYTGQALVGVLAYGWSLTLRLGFVDNLLTG
jgi:hypothetical protein